MKKTLLILTTAIRDLLQNSFSMTRSEKISLLLVLAIFLIGLIAKTFFL